MLNLSEIFFSIQGESSFTGFPCIFIRLSGCNLRCKYCDTVYSYETKFTLSVNDILKKIEKYNPIKLVEITGGEPLLQNEVYKLFHILKDNDYKILLETNGSINLKNVPEDVIKIVDVKCPSSGYEKSFLKENLNYIDAEKDELKYVISNREDYLYALDFIRENDLQNYKNIFSPVLSELSPETLAEWLLVDKSNYRMQLQLHKYIWGRNTKGV
ncbi:MAG TPA: radical SAM protein [Candidatus Cloacimonetes bacterium]|nr:radical SAM protein [Candidatus Cloacimonadota bacterium]